MCGYGQQGQSIALQICWLLLCGGQLSPHPLQLLPALGQSTCVSPYPTMISLQKSFTSILCGYGEQGQSTVLFAQQIRLPNLCGGQLGPHPLQLLPASGQPMVILKANIQAEKVKGAHECEKHETKPAASTVDMSLQICLLLLRGCQLSPHPSSGCLHQVSPSAFSPFDHLNKLVHMQAAGQSRLESWKVELHAHECQKSGLTSAARTVTMFCALQICLPLLGSCQLSPHPLQLLPASGQPTLKNGRCKFVTMNAKSLK